MKSALFVDFDNVYSGLRKLDLSIADCFARTPQRWMSWLVDSLELPRPAAEGARRRILVRRCYLNPQVYQTLFHLIGTDLATHAFDLKETGKRVRDATRASGQLVSRSDVNWILRGLLLRGHAFGSGEDDARTLSRKTVENLRSLCLREQMVIDQGIDHALERWINQGV